MMHKFEKLSIIIPCYNEESTIEIIVEEIASINLGKVKKEIIIVDDKSSDNSAKIIQKLEKKHKNVKAIYRTINEGKGSALKSGFLISSGDLVIIQDADREYDPRDYSKMITIFQEDRADIVFGSRFSGGEPRRVAYLQNIIANKFMTRLSALLNGLYVSDIHTCYIMFNGEWIRKNANNLKSKRFGFNPEIVAKIAKNKNSLRICETNISYYPRTRKEGKKIGYKDGVSAIWDIIRFNI